MASLFEGTWSCQDFIEARQEDRATVRISNNSKRAEHTCVLRLRTSSCLSVSIESTDSDYIYSVEVLPRDLLVPVYQEASLLWVKLLFAKALSGEITLNLNFITMDELKVNSVFYREPVSIPNNVAEEDAAAVVMEVRYSMEGKAYQVLLQVPRLLPEDWKTGEIEELFDHLIDPSDVLMKSREMETLLKYVRDEKEHAEQLLEETRLELERMKAT